MSAVYLCAHILFLHSMYVCVCMGLLWGTICTFEWLQSSNILMQNGCCWVLWVDWTGMCEDGKQSKAAAMLGKAASPLKWLYSMHCHSELFQASLVKDCGMHEFKMRSTADQVWQLSLTKSSKFLFIYFFVAGYCVGEWVRGNSDPVQILTHKKKTHSHEHTHTH